MNYRLGIDVGSTTVKVVIINDSNDIIFSDYRRHFANIKETLSDLVSDALTKLGDCTIYANITGSGGFALSTVLNIPFSQEVVCVSKSYRKVCKEN